MEQRAKMHPGKVHGVAGRPSQWHGTNIIISFSTFIPICICFFVFVFVFVSVSFFDKCIMVKFKKLLDPSCNGKVCYNSHGSCYDDEISQNLSYSLSVEEHDLRRKGCRNIFLHLGKT